jgi:hypothetical protein
MTDESFKYIQHNPDGTTEHKIGTNNDVYIFLRDIMDLKLCELENELTKQSRSEYNWCLFTAIVMSVLMSLTIVFCVMEAAK